MRLTPLFFAATLAAMPATATAQSVAPREPLLTVAGNGSVSRSPDRARIGMDIITTDDVAARSGGKNTVIYNAFVSRVAASGVAADDVRTTSYNVAFVPYPPKDLPAEQRQPRYGYITTRSLSVIVSPLERAGQVVDAATASGVTQIGDVGFELKDRHAVYLAALAAAMSDAKTTANAVATAGAFAIVRIRSVNAGLESPGGPEPLAMPRVATMSGSVPPTTIAPNGPIDVSAHVTVTYEIR